MAENNIFDEIKRIEQELGGVMGPMAIVSLKIPNQEPLKQIARIPISSVYETESSVIAAFELPGVNKEDIELFVDQEYLQVKVNQKEEPLKENQSSLQSIKQNFYGSVLLPAEVIADKANAVYQNGILRIEIPKAVKQESRRRIEIK